MDDPERAKQPSGAGGGGRRPGGPSTADHLASRACTRAERLCSSCKARQKSRARLSQGKCERQSAKKPPPAAGQAISSETLTVSPAAWLRNRLRHSALLCSQIVRDDGAAQGATPHSRKQARAPATLGDGRAAGHVALERGSAVTGACPERCSSLRRSEKCLVCGSQRWDGRRVQAPAPSLWHRQVGLQVFARTFGWCAPKT